MVALLKMPKQSAEKTGAERRVFPRKEMSADVESRRLDHTIPAHRFPRFQVALRDVSMGGLSAITPMPLAPGERLSFAFPNQGDRQSWAAAGHVIRCEMSSMGYRIAVEFDGMMAA